MKHIMVLLSTLISFNVFGQSTADEKQVRAVIQTSEDSYNAHDFSYSGKYDLFVPDAVLVNPVGMYWKNRAEIIQASQVLGNIRLKYESAKYTIKALRFLAPGAALMVVYAAGRVEQDYNFPDGSKGGSKGDITKAMYSLTLTKINSNWKISSMQITHIDPVAAQLNPVKD